MKPPFGVRWAKRAAKERDNIDRGTRQRLIDAVDEFARTGAGDVKALQGAPGSFRLRVGDYRVIFSAAPAESEITIERVAHRRESYR